MTTYPAHPPLECDLVMKGGITSGVIYPGTVCELAKTYRFRSIGGASAGAIAAAATAAAELGRNAGGFKRLASMPTRLTKNGTNGRSTLFNLFQPHHKQQRLFGLLTAHMLQPGAGQVFSTLRAALMNYPGRVVAGSLAALGVLALGATSGNPWGIAGAILGAAAMALLLIPLLVVLGIVKDVKQIERFGLCSGMPERGHAGPPTLTEWLHEEFQALAGLDPAAPPLTFGQLENADIELRMMTTNLTQGMPMTLPWAKKEYFFDPAEFRQLFPAAIVQWMTDHPAAITDNVSHQMAGRPLLPFPGHRDLPVVVATRMSLSFPGLIQAVPLYAVNWTDPANHKTLRPEHVTNWFSDGGVCANIPVHMFDSPLPTRPTFAVNLAPFGPPPEDDEAKNSYLPADAGAGRLLRWKDIGDGSGAALPSFLMSIVSTARGWVDARQLIMPGYRGRVVTIYHTEREGGMNLNMAPDVVRNLAARGAGAGAKLVDRFAGPNPGTDEAEGWAVHRWTRMRLSLAGHQEWLSKFAGAFTTSNGDRAYADFFTSTQKPPAYKPSDGRRKKMGDLTEALVATSAEWTQDAVADETAPSPLPVLRLTTELDDTRRASD